MINYLFILIFIGLIFLIILQKLIETNEIKKFKKINFLSVYLSLFILSYISISITYYFLGSPNISKSMLLEIKEKKQLVKKEQKQRIEKTKNDLKIIDEMLRTDPQNLNLLLAKASMAAIIQDLETEIETLKKIIKIIHPEIIKKMNIFLKKNKKSKLIVLDIPLLLENKINKRKDILIFVQSKKSEILKRLKKRQNFNSKIMNRFRKIQLPLDYKRKKSNFIIKNNFTNRFIKKQIKYILKQIH